MKTHCIALAWVATCLTLACSTGPRTPPPPRLEGTSWNLVSAMGQPALPDVAVTLSFGTDGRVTGSGGVNRYTADYTLEGDRLRVGILGSTRRAGPSKAMDQENRFFTVLQAAVRVELQSGMLRVFGDSFQTPLVLARAR